MAASESFELHSRPRRSPSLAQQQPAAPQPPEAFADTFDSGSDSDLALDDFEDPSSPTAGLLSSSSSSRKPKHHQKGKPHVPPWWARWLFLYPRTTPSPSPLRRRRRRGLRICCNIFLGWLALSAVWIVLTIIFLPSYTKSQHPESYSALESAIASGGGQNPPELWQSPPPPEDAETKHTKPGRGNPKSEKVFIAANIVSAELIEKEWGWRVMELLDMLGPSNCFLSVFENDSGERTKKALKALDERIRAHMPDVGGLSIVSTTLPFEGVPRTVVKEGKDGKGGESWIKRITYLAEVRNRAILPLVGSIPSLARWNQTGHPKSATPTTYSLSPYETLPPLSDSAVSHAPQPPPQFVEHPKEYNKLLFLNDVVFSPAELTHLLFSTNAGNFSAACAADFINPLKFYDTFATRDSDGWSLGVPFFPYFATPGPREMVLDTSDAVPVRSCWGGVVAFDAAPFLGQEGVRFRAEKEPYWDASECCLVHADIDQPHNTYVNFFVRVAYDRRTFEWLPAVRRMERVMSWMHWVLAKVLGMPWAGERREEKDGNEREDWVWDSEGGEWKWRKRKAGKGEWCGSRKMLVMREERKKGERGWRGLEVPKFP